MPLISDLSKEKKAVKDFQKKSYRPWDEDLQLKSQPSIKEKVLNLNEDFEDNNSNLAILKKELRNLSTCQKKVIENLIINIEESSNLYVITKDISMSELISACSSLPNTIRTAIQKLKQKKIIETYENKPGRGGYARYKIPNDIFQFFLKNLIKK